MIATIGLHDLRVECVIGLHPREREAPQALRVDVELDADTAVVAESQRIEDAVDYEQVARVIHQQAQRGFLLIEALAEHTARALLEDFPTANVVRLEIRKPGALTAAADSFVRLERGR